MEVLYIGYHSLIIIYAYALIMRFMYLLIGYGRLYMDACKYAVRDPSLLAK